MKVVILCGGQGTRLREETEYRPKPLVEIGGRPILWHIMKRYASYGFREFVLCLGYRGSMIKEYFLNYEAMNSDFSISLGKKAEIRFHGAHDEQDYKVTLVDTGLESMTGGRIKRVQRYIEDPHFMVTYGDGLADIDVAKLVDFHTAHGKLATVTTVKPTSRFGMLDIDGAGKVARFVEKPRLDGAVNAGFFVLSRKIFDLLPGDDCIFEREPLEKLAADGELMAHHHPGFFHAMDTYREYVYLNELWASGKAPWRTDV